jgi:hypothetical protein
MFDDFESNSVMTRSKRHRCSNLVHRAMQASIDCNNMGVALLRSGRLQEALETLKDAARIMFSVSQYFERHEELLMGAEHGPAVQRAKRFTSLFIEQQPTRNQNSPICVPLKSLQNDLYVDLEPIKIMETVYSRLKPAQNCTLESATIVFNMALNYLCLGSEPCCRRALELLDITLSLVLLRVDDKKDAIQVNGIVIQSLHTMGEVYFWLGDYKRSRHSLDSLTSFILALPSNLNDLDLRKKRFQYLLNAMLLQEPTLSAAA